jgi:hypothetical protein
MGDTDEADAGQDIPPLVFSMMGDIERPGAGFIDTVGDAPSQSRHRNREDKNFMLNVLRRLLGQQPKPLEAIEAPKTKSKTLLRFQTHAARATVTFEKKPSGLPSRSR